MRKGGIYLAIGDSTSWSIPGDTTTKGDQLYAFRVRDAIRANYGSVRLISKGIGGASSQNVVNSFVWNLRVVPDLVTIGLGMNADSGGVTQYKNNLIAIIDKVRQMNPNAHIILCTPNTTTDAARTHADSYRTAMSEVAVSKNVDICRFEEAFTSAQIATYAPDLTHPNGAGHQLMYNLLWSVVQKGAWLKKLS